MIQHHSLMNINITIQTGKLDVFEKLIQLIKTNLNGKLKIIFYKSKKNLNYKIKNQQGTDEFENKFNQAKQLLVKFNMQME